MKDFAKSVRTGNATIDPKDDTLRKLEDELRGWLKTYDSKDPNVDKANVEKNIREIRAEIEKYKRKHNIWNTNAGNSKVGNKAIVLKDGEVWVVLYANETKSQEFETEAEARAFASKVGNESIDKQEWSMFNGLRKKAESEIGNAYKENPELTKILEAWLHNRIKEEEAREKILKITGDKNITDMMIRKPGGFIPVGNEETKAEEKYGKVMEEFFDGKLKSGSGEKVTDPAQAKAIAYSEADKVDNLKRARNAMKK